MNLRFPNPTSRKQAEAQAMCAALGYAAKEFADVAMGLGTIYFVRSDAMKAIKIGFSFDLPKRLQSLQTGSSGPLVLLATIRDTSAKERELHEKFATLRLHGEWFKPNKRLRDFIAALPGASQL